MAEQARRPASPASTLTQQLEKLIKLFSQDLALAEDLGLDTTTLKRQLSSTQARYEKHLSRQEGQPAGNAMTSNNLFPSFLDTSNASNNAPIIGNAPRLAPSPMGSSQQGQSNVNGNNASAMNGLPMAAGTQMDVNFLYQKVVELSEVLRDNREKTQAIVAGAEELATRAAANGASPSLQEANAELSAARIADLERRLVKEQNNVRILKHEQNENIELIAKWEHEVGELLRRVREHTFDNKQEQINIARHYNKLLQEEKDAHLAARLEKDDWHAKFMRCCGMIREAHRLRCEEEDQPISVIAALQEEVRALRSAMGMEAEKPEEETGHEFLKDIPSGPIDP